MNAVSQQSCNSHGRSRYTGRGERLIARCISAAVTCPSLPQDICIRLLLCKHCSGAASQVNSQHCMTLHAAIRNLTRDAAVISVSCDRHCVVEYCESRSPVGPAISWYGDPTNNADLLDRNICDVDRHTSTHCAYPWRNGQAEYAWVTG